MYEIFSNVKDYLPFCNNSNSNNNNKIGLVINLVARGLVLKLQCSSVIRNFRIADFTHEAFFFVFALELTCTFKYFMRSSE